jgi:hypothetical protein
MRERRLSGRTPAVLGVSWRTAGIGATAPYGARGPIGRIPLETCHSVKFACRLIGGAGSGTVGMEEAIMRTAIPLPVPSKRAPWNRPPHRPEAPSEAERGLGHSGSASAAGSETRSRLVQPCDRQQAPRLRSRPFAGRRRMRRRQDAGSWHRNPKKTGRPVQFEITEQTQASIRDWLAKVELWNGRYLFPSPSTSLPGNTLAPFVPGSRVWGSMVRPTAHIRCVGRRRRRSCPSCAHSSST